MGQQLLEFDRGSSIRKKDRAMAAVRAPDSFRERAREAIRWCAEHYQDFTTDQVWERFGYLPEGFSLRALGPVMVSIAKEGVIVQTGRVRNTQMKNKHARPLQIWRKGF